MAREAAPPADIAALSFEDAMRELESIVARLERGDVALEESIAIYTRGTELKTHCERTLAKARARIEKLVVGRDGGLTVEPFDKDPRAEGNDQAPF